MVIKHLKPPLFIMGLVIMLFALSIMVKQTFQRQVPSIEPAIQTTNTGSFKIFSPSFDNNATIPTAYTCNGANTNPPLIIENAPGNAKSFALIVRDRSASDNNSTQWTVWNIPVETTAIAENTVPEGAVQGVTDFGSSIYSGPCPARDTGNHKYSFELYALTDMLNIGPGANRDQLISAMNGLIIAKTHVTGEYKPN